jgi:hypothetical protein
MKPRTMASRPEISITRIRTISSSVIGMGYDSATIRLGFWRSAACIAGLRHAVTHLLAVVSAAG